MLHLRLEAQEGEGSRFCPRIFRIHPSPQRSKYSCAHPDYAKRCECYCDETLTVGKRVFCVFMISFGSFMKAKFHNGENPLARAFGKCLFDEVYLWVEEPLVVRERRCRHTESYWGGSRNWWTRISGGTLSCCSNPSSNCSLTLRILKL